MGWKEMSNGRLVQFHISSFRNYDPFYKRLQSSDMEVKKPYYQRPLKGKGDDQSFAFSFKRFLGMANRC